MLLSQRRRAMRLAVFEGACYAAMVGFGEAYFVADALRYGASALELGLLIALPLCTGALGPILALWLMGRGLRRKPVLVAGTALQACILLSMVAAELLGWLSPWTLIALVCAYQVCAQTGGVCWASWFGDVVPIRLRGRYFSRRNRIIHAVTCTSVVCAGVLLQVLEPGAVSDVAIGAGGKGFVLIVSVAAGFRVLSSSLIALTPEPAFHGKPIGVRGMGRALESGSVARHVILVSGALQLCVYLASPYFAPFMLEGLRFSYLEYTTATVVAVLAKVLALPAWGRVVDQHGARAPWLFALAVIAVLPLPWCFATGLGLAVAAQILSGFAWGGHELSQFTVLLESSKPHERPHIFAALGIGIGISQLTGTLLGAALLSATERSFATLFAISACARMLVAISAPAVVPASVGRPSMRWRHVMLRLAGVRPSGGLSHRALPMADVEVPVVSTTPKTERRDARNALND